MGWLIIAFITSIGVPAVLLWLINYDEKRHREIGYVEFRVLLDSGVLDPEYEATPAAPESRIQPTSPLAVWRQAI